MWAQTIWRHFRHILEQEYPIQSLQSRTLFNLYIYIYIHLKEQSLIYVRLSTAPSKVLRECTSTQQIFASVSYVLSDAVYFLVIISPEPARMLFQRGDGSVVWNFDWDHVAFFGSGFFWFRDTQQLVLELMSASTVSWAHCKDHSKTTQSNPGVFPVPHLADDLQLKEPFTARLQSSSQLRHDSSL